MSSRLDLFAEQPFGQIALKRLGPVAPNFRLFRAEWLGKNSSDWKVMKVTGAEFRAVKRGPDAGDLTIRIPGTTRTTYVTKDEMEVLRRRRGAGRRTTS